MYPSEAEMWNVIVQYLILDHGFTPSHARKSANNVRYNGELEKIYKLAQS